jgi:hypothetical protein
MESIPRFTLGADPDDIARALTTIGAAIIERLVDESTVDRMLAEMQPHVEATSYGSDNFTGLTTKRTGALLARSVTSRDFVGHPEVLAVVDRVLGPVSTSYQLHLTQMICIWPGGPAQSLHRDQWCFDMFPFPPEMDVEVSTIWALDDFTEENGATRIIPNSLLDPASATADVHRTIPATMPKGSVVLYTGREPVPVVSTGGRSHASRTLAEVGRLQHGRVRPRIHGRHSRSVRRAEWFRWWFVVRWIEHARTHGRTLETTSCPNASIFPASTACGRCRFCSSWRSTPDSSRVAGSASTSSSPSPDFSSPD